VTLLLQYISNTCYPQYMTKFKYIQKAFVRSLTLHFIHISWYILFEYPEVVKLCCQYWFNMSKMRINKKWLLLWTVWRKITNIKSSRKRSFKRERGCVYDCEYVTKTKGLSKNIVPPVWFIECAFEIPRVVLNMPKTSNFRVRNFECMERHSILHARLHVVTLKRRQTLKYSYILFLSHNSVMR
jgi:hypothetical protein